MNQDTFAPLTGQVFTIAEAGWGRLELELSAVRVLGHKRTDAPREPFSLLFRGAHGMRLPQGTYLFGCEALGEIGLFITQIADGPEGSEFEAIFT